MPSKFHRSFSPLLILSAVALVAAIDAASAAPRGRPGGVAVQSKPNEPVTTSGRGLANTQAKPRGQVRSQLMYSIGHINGEPGRTR